MAELPYLLGEYFFAEDLKPVEDETPAAPVPKVTTPVEAETSTAIQKKELVDLLETFFLLYGSKTALKKILEVLEISRSSDSADKRLHEIDKRLPLPPDISASRLAKALKVSKQAVLKTPWWKKRRRAREEEIEERRDRLIEKTIGYESSRRNSWS